VLDNAANKVALIWHCRPGEIDILNLRVKKNEMGRGADRVLFVLAGTMKAKDAAGSELEQELSRAIRESAAEVVRKVIDKAKEGSYLHAKFLFDFAGLDLKRSAAEDEGDNESLASYLLRELREPPREDGGSAA
jgi:hypothetical protein